MADNAQIDTEVAFFLRLVNCRRSRRGDWNSSILEHAQLHLTVPDAIERAVWSTATSTVEVTINLNRSTVALPLLEELSIFIPQTRSPFCYVSSTASHTAAAIAHAISSKLESSEFLALTLLNAIDQAVKQCNDTMAATNDGHLRALVEARVLAQSTTNKAECDVLMCLLVAAASSPKGLSPCSVHFQSQGVDIDRRQVNAALTAVPALATLDVTALPLPALHLLEWLWCRLPVSIKQIEPDQVASVLPPSCDLPHVCFAATVVQTANPWFDRQAAKFGVKMCYHGSRLASFHSILQNGLHVMSGTRHMSSGNLFGDGIYFAESVHVAANFASPTPTTWPNSAVLAPSATCVAVCEVICDPAASKLLPSSQANGAYVVVQDERFVRVKYLLFTQPPTLSHVGNNDRSTLGLPALVAAVCVAVMAVVGVRLALAM
ncbi:hypothetical protein H257_07859 [Aphanomyces astaci]|uniref:PARP catalytic domain-containing protein n=1 Tax=Aphanomyces astaci TaxID=112090 RepID=W4GJF1_APHAT|nr:hypothetical protein H257_07859 [Aphanomyces astaci]ETV79124.1 hypothetical protein H257_07859 [Aphanomyces astaci]|eukprot:XP_009831843.1 hypothetical protein H257_07859 [Aphanomyces astaci]